MLDEVWLGCIEFWVLICFSLDERFLSELAKVNPHYSNKAVAVSSAPQS